MPNWVKRSTLALLLSVFLCGPASAQSSNPGVGAIPYSGGTTFRVWAPFASNVGVKGGFNGWTSAGLVSEGDGYWSRDIAGAAAGHQYKYVITYNGFTFDRTDARARRVTHSNGNSIIYDHSAYNWQGDSFNTPWHNDLVIYEMHTGSFNPQSNGWTPGKFWDAINRLDHLQAMGVNAVELMPVNEFYGDHSWGYNPADLYAVETAFGGANGLKDFVRECHNRGIAVLLDIVHNHYGPSDLSLWQYDGWNQNGHGGIYFYNDNRRYTDWGETRPDYGRPEVQEFIKDQVRMWIDDYHIDGFRWDAVYSITHTGFDLNSQGESLMWDLNSMIHNEYPGTISIAEDDAFGRGFDSEWAVGWHGGLREQLIDPSDSNRSVSYLASLINSGANHGRVLFSESHDTVAVENGKQRLPREIDGSNPESIWARKRTLLGAGMVLTSVGIPMLFQGQELLETFGFKAQDALRWDRATTHAGIVQAFTDLVHLRRNLTGDTQGLKGTGSNAYHVDETNKILAFHRWDNGGVGDDVVVVMNFSANVWDSNSYSIEFPYAGTWYTLFNSDSTVYGSDFGNVGAGQIEATGNPPEAAVNMGMYGILVFARSRNQVPPPGQVTVDPSAPLACEPVTIRYAPNGSVLDGVDPVYIQIGRDNWQDVITPAPTMTQTNGEWVYTYTPTTALGEVNFIFFDGASDFDNNRGLDWSVTYSDCQGNPADVTVQPSVPTACDPVTLSYTPNDGPLSGATQIVAYLGPNAWSSIAEIPMTLTGGTWEVVYTPPADTEDVQFVFHDGNTNLPQRIWDNNGGQDWSVVFPDCLVAFELRIVTPGNATTVPYTNDQLTVLGTASANITDDVQVLNLSTGFQGSTSVSSTWSLATVPFTVGVNELVAYTDGSPMETNASDDASDAAYASGWNHGQDGGSGFWRGWQLANGANAGHFKADSAGNPNLDIGTTAWGLWANSGDSSEAVRSFDRVLAVGSTFRVDFENNSIDTDRSTGIGLQNDVGENLIQFYFVGGGTNYWIQDLAGETETGLNWTDTGVQVTISLLSPNAYVLTAGSVLHTGMMAAASNRRISKFHVWNFSAGGGGDHNVYLNNLEVDGPQWDVFDNVTIFRLPASGMIDLDGDGLPDDWEQVLINADTGDAIETIEQLLATDDFDGDGRSNLEEYLAGTDATNANDFLHVRIRMGSSSPVVAFDSKSGRKYNLWFVNALSPAETWQNATTGTGPLSGNNAELEWPDAPSGLSPVRAYRVEAFPEE